MSPEVYQALADLVGAFPRIVMVAVGLAAFGVLVAMAVSEVVLRYGETGPGEYSAMDRRDGRRLDTQVCPSHVVTGREVTPPTGVDLLLATGPVGVEEPGEAVSAPPAAPARPAAASSQPLSFGAGTRPAFHADPLLTAGLPPAHRSAKAARYRP